MRYFERTVLFHRPTGDRSFYVPVRGSFSFDFEVPAREFPVTCALRFAGEPDYFWKWRREAGSPYSISQCIDDALDSRDTWHEAFALRFDCRKEPYDREAWIKLKQGTFQAGAEYTFQLPVKRENFSSSPGSWAGAELEIRRIRPGRHPDDVFDPPDELHRLTTPAGSAPWTVLEKRFTMPADGASCVVHIFVGQCEGTLLLGSPKLVARGEEESILPPLERQQHREREFCYAAANISRREWIEFECKVDEKQVFDGEMYTSIVRRPDFEIPCSPLAPGKHRVTFRFKNDYPAAVGFVFQQLELLEYGNHDFELVAAPEFVKEGSPARFLIRTAAPGVRVSAAGRTFTFPEPGLDVLELPPPASEEEEIAFESPGNRESCTLRRVPAFADADTIYLSTGDTVYVRQTPEDMVRFLEWYLSHDIGNAVCFRHSYRWGGGRWMDPDIWRTVIPLLQKLGIAYSCMVDGRELPGRNANPPDELLAGPGYLGRQAHENDGAFDYWNNRLWKPEPLPEPMADILSRSVDAGGIQPRVRPKRRGNESWWFFDPTDCRNMKEAAEAFVRNLREAKGESTRHSGPSVLFRYFFQAGYELLMAEQMYGPEELVLSALRGASKAYGADGCGAHLALQWGSTPHDTPEHAERYFLSLAACWLQGVTRINTEEGLYRMEKGYAEYDRFSENCRRHREVHTKFRRFMESHPRRGRLVVPIACIQGRYDGWSCFSRSAPVWYRRGEEWKFGPAEESFDLLKLFFPRSRLAGISRCPCPAEPQGWYTGTPYGPADLLPFEGDWSSYRCVIFLGWHTFEKGDGEKMLRYVEQGGTLLLSRRHLSRSSIHNGVPEYESDPALDALLGPDWRERSGVSRRKCGRGEVLFFASDAYPAEEEFRQGYEEAMREIAEKACAEEMKTLYVRANEDVNFCVRERADGSREAALLNIRWWDKAPSRAVIVRNGKEEEIEVPEGVILLKE